MDNITRNIKQAQIFELIGESFCAIGSILYIIDSFTHGTIKLYTYSILYLIGSFLFLIGSILMIIQSVYTIYKINT